MRTLNPLIGLFLALFLFACTKAPAPEDNAGAADESSPAATTEPGGEGTISIPSGKAGVPDIQVEVLATGDGAQAKAGQTVFMHYVGTLLNGTQFDSSRDRGSPFSFRLGARQVIDGWDVIGAQMRVGDRWKCTIPWQLAYGAGGNGPIPPRANLVFDMELIRVQ